MSSNILIILSEGVIALPNMYAQLLPRQSLLSLTSGVETDTVSGMAQLISEHGFEVVIVAVFLIVFIGAMSIFVKIFNTQNQATMEQNKQLIESILKMLNNQYSVIQQTSVSQASQAKTDPESTHMVSDGLLNNTILSDAAKAALGELRCSRTAVYAFHNGSKTQYGLHFLKMSCIIEETAPGSKTARGPGHRNMPISSFTGIVSSLVNNNEYMVGNIYNHGIVTADSQIIGFMMDTDIHALFAYPIKDSNKEVAGFVLAEYKDEQDFSSRALYDSSKKALKEFAESVTSIVTNKGYQ